VSQVIALQPGEAYSRSRLISSGATPGQIRRARKSIANYLTKILSRAQEADDRYYFMHTTTGLTKSCDVIATGIIVVAAEDNEI